MGPHPADSASCTMCGVYTLSMPVFERTSIELPNALSGSKELRLCPCAMSTRTVAVCAESTPAMNQGTQRRISFSRAELYRVGQSPGLFTSEASLPLGRPEGGICKINLV